MLCTASALPNLAKLVSILKSPPVAVALGMMLGAELSAQSPFESSGVAENSLVAKFLEALQQSLLVHKS